MEVRGLEGDAVTGSWPKTARINIEIHGLNIEIHFEIS